MNINWKVRFRNKAFWLGFIPAAIILVQAVGQLFGYNILLDGVEDNLTNVIEALFAVLAILGIVVDPTTAGLSDGYYGLQYTYPGVIEEFDEVEEEEEEVVEEGVDE